MRQAFLTLCFLLIATAALSQGATCVRHLIPPEYPELARQSQITGTVVVRAKIDGNGRVISTSIADSTGADRPHKLLEQAADQNLRKWRFSPGEPKTLDVTYEFRLEKPDALNSPVPNIEFDLPARVTITSKMPGPIQDNVTVHKKH